MHNKFIEGYMEDLWYGRGLVSPRAMFALLILWVDFFLLPTLFLISFYLWVSLKSKMFKKEF